MSLPWSGQTCAGFLYDKHFTEQQLPADRQEFSVIAGPDKAVNFEVDGVRADRHELYAQAVGDDARIAPQGVGCTRAYLLDLGRAGFQEKTEFHDGAGTDRIRYSSP